MSEVYQARLFEVDKRCTKCGEVKPLEDFGKDRSTRDGLYCRCKRCLRRNPEQAEYIARLDSENAAKGLRRCSKCQMYWPLTDFYANRRMRDGLHVQCKKCSDAYSRAWAQRNPEKIQAKTYAHYWSDPEQARSRVREYANSEEGREKQNAWKAANSEKVKSYQKRSRESHKEEYAEIRRRWWLNNPDKAKANDHRRRARLADAEGELSGAEWREKLASYQGLCHWCKEFIDGSTHMDHVIPLVRGGRHDIDNVVPACGPCNLSKGALMPEEWLQKLEAEAGCT